MSFYIPAEEITAAIACETCGGQLVPSDRQDTPIAGLSSLSSLKAGSLIFVHPRRTIEVTSSLATVNAIVCDAQSAKSMPAGPAIIIVDAPHRAFSAIGRRMYPECLGPARASAQDDWRDDYPDAKVSRTATIEAGVDIGPGVIIGDHAGIGSGSVIGANTVITDHCQVGRNCQVGVGVSIQYSLIGNDVIIHGGAQLGQDGFGYLPGPGGLEKVPQLGRVIVQDRVEIGANTTIDRGALDDTVIGEGTKIDNLVQIAHNVIIGRYCVIAAHSGLSGSVTLGDGCMLGGRVGIADHVTIGSGVQIAAASGVMNDIPDGERWAGAPAQPVKGWFREIATLRKMTRVDKKPNH